MSKTKILVIEDNPLIVRLNEKILSSQGYEILCAKDGREGIDRAVSEKPDLILLDIILPVVHGFDVCRELKANPETKDIPIIIMTATGLENVAKNEPEIKAQGYIAKPYTFEQIDGLIKEVLGRG